MNEVIEVPLIDTAAPLINAGLGAVANVTVAVVALRAIVEILVPGMPVPNKAWVMSALLVAKGIVESGALPTQDAPTQV